MTGRVAVYAGIAAVAASVSLGIGAARPGTADPAVAPDGAALFRAKGCTTCHDGPDGVSSIDAGPPLSDAAEWAGDRVDGLSEVVYLAQSMRSPSAFISPDFRPGLGGPGGGSMPLLRLSDVEIDALVDYLLGRD